MLFTLLMSLLTTFVVFVLSLLPSFSVPAWMDYEMGGYAHTIGSYVYKLGFWFPTEDVGVIFTFVGTMIPIVVTVITVVFLFGLMPFIGKKFGG